MIGRAPQIRDFFPFLSFKYGTHPCCNSTVMFSEFDSDDPPHANGILKAHYEPTSTRGEKKKGKTGHHAKLIDPVIYCLTVRLGRGWLLESGLDSLVNGRRLVPSIRQLRKWRNRPKGKKGIFLKCVFFVGIGDKLIVVFHEGIELEI